MSDFDHSSTTDDVLAGHDLTGRRVIVTGASTCLGDAAVWELSERLVGIA